MSLKTRVLILVAIVAVIGILLAVSGRRADVTIGSKNFTEQEILGEIMATLIEEQSDLSVGRRFYLGGTMICFNALRAGGLDLYAEYTGTGLVNILDREVIEDPDEAYALVKDVFDEEYDLVWLEPFGFNNTYTLTMRQEQAEELGIRTISDLAEHIQNEPTQITAGFDHEFLERPDGYPGLIEHYDFRFVEEPRQMDPGLMYRACADGSVDVICAFATDGRIAAYDLVVLEDDRNFFPPYYAAPLIRRDTLERHPELQRVLNMLAGRLDDETMQQLNYRVDEEQHDPAEAARDFLIQEGLIEAAN